MLLRQTEHTTCFNASCSSLTKIQVATSDIKLCHFYKFFTCIMFNAIFSNKFFNLKFAFLYVNGTRKQCTTLLKNYTLDVVLRNFEFYETSEFLVHLLVHLFGSLIYLLQQNLYGMENPQCKISFLVPYFVF